MTEDEALKAFFVEWSRQASEYGGYLTCEQRDCAEEAWNAALAWLRSQGEPVAWLNPYGGVLKQLSTGLERNTYTIPLFLAPQPAIPDGWQQVPKEPTPEMVKAMQDTFWTGKSTYSLRTTDAYRVFFAMLAAAPEPSK